jgi:dihydrodipicolinate synthase/N-acetylneuraminate lyase
MSASPKEYDLLLEERYQFTPMKLLLALIASGLISVIVSASAAEPSKETEREQQQVVALVKEVQGQQAAIADNQTKIDAKMATIAEALRLARIYSSRGGR